MCQVLETLFLWSFPLATHPFVPKTVYRDRETVFLSPSPFSIRIFGSKTVYREQKTVF